MGISLGLTIYGPIVPQSQGALLEPGSMVGLPVIPPTNGEHFGLIPSLIISTPPLSNIGYQLAHTTMALHARTLR
jgi:hypothetical protein